TGFGAGGSIRTPIGLLRDQAAGVDFQTIGANAHKIVVGGYYAVSHADLEVDTAFPTFVTSATRPFGPQDVGNFIQITSNVNGFTIGDYQIIGQAAGFAQLGQAPAAPGATGGRFELDRDTTQNFRTNEDFALVRYMPDGNIDTSFGNSGKVIT